MMTVKGAGNAMLVGRWADSAVKHAIATSLILLASAVIFAVASLEGQLPRPWFIAFGRGAPASLIGALVAVAAALAIARPTLLQPMSWAVAAAWLGSSVAAAFAIFKSGLNVASFVALVESATLFAACLSIAGVARPTILHVASAAMLIVFGVVHLVWHDAIASLIPDFVPFPNVWPWITGTLQLGAGLGSISARLASNVFPLIAGIFLAWLPLVHIPRIIADPSIGEGSFAAMAAALAGCLLLASGQVSPRRRR